MGTKLVWTESAEDRLTGFPGNRIAGRVFAVVLFIIFWLCCVAIALLVPDPVLSRVLTAVVTVGFVIGGVALAAFGGRGAHRRRIARLQVDHPHAVLIACTQVNGLPWAVRQVARATGIGTGRPYLLIAGFVLAVESDRISFLSGRRSMVVPTDDLDRIRRGTGTIPSGFNGPLVTRSTIDLGFTLADGQVIVVQLCPIPIDQEPRHHLRPFELGVIARKIDLAIRSDRLQHPSAI